MLPHVTIQLPISVSLLSNVWLSFDKDSAHVLIFLIFVSVSFLSLVEPQNWYGGERGGGWEFKEEDGGFKKK
jgi:hypothetical protein